MHRMISHLHLPAQCLRRPYLTAAGGVLPCSGRVTRRFAAPLRRGFALQAAAAAAIGDEPGVPHVSVMLQEVLQAFGGRDVKVWRPSHGLGKPKTHSVLDRTRCSCWTARDAAAAHHLNRCTSTAPWVPVATRCTCCGSTL